MDATNDSNKFPGSMDPHRVFVLTDQGNEAWRTRSRQLSNRMRSLMAMLTGHNTVADLIRIDAFVGDIPQMLTTLRTLGLIAEVPRTGAQRPPPPPPGPAADDLPATNQSTHVVRAKALIIDYIRATRGSVRAQVLIEFVAALETAQEVAASLTIVGERLARHRGTASLDDLRRNVLALLKDQ